MCWGRGFKSEWSWPMTSRMAEFHRYDLHEPVQMLGRAMMRLELLERRVALGDVDGLPPELWRKVMVAQVLAEEAFDVLKGLRDKDLL